ncbi:hypothetical protein L211DRAFT_313422 [Terfezia boudieri ATCC MYA-4762]|uniref:Uncharacterized protein n=1 Tax=Terfezia boudieri ATCC MYA-4762 TaxID=1051890 RepID=A0A3N4LM94_9PEZI|nr:hypothetical protein L211DRAFT_313422 [Terfezia boudieri ATCC MYA-4762]
MSLDVEAKLTGNGVAALDIEDIKKLLKTSSVCYHRSGSVLIGARRATEEDMKSPLITYVTNLYGKLFIETIKEFSEAEIESGIIILRYPGPIYENRYNEWYITEKEWKEKYDENPKKKWNNYKAKKAVQKKGLEITPEVINLLKGKDGRAEIKAFGGTMWAFEDGLLTEDGTAIAPQILTRYFFKI